MSTSLSEALPEALKNLHTRPLFVLREQVPPLLVVGQTPNAFRRIGVIQGGSFEGERLSGEVVAGNDWQAVRTDSCIKLDVRLLLKTTDGALIVMTYQCLRAGPPSVIEKLDKGEVVSSISTSAACSRTAVSIIERICSKTLKPRVFHPGLLSHAITLQPFG